MRAILPVVSAVLLALGIPATALAALALVYSWSAPIHPSSSTDIGPAIAAFFGWMLLLPGILAVLSGIALRISFKVTHPRPAYA